MRILYVYCHPLTDSFHAAIRRAALPALARAGHAVDLLDLYGESFAPALSAEACRSYLDPSHNHEGLEPFVARLQSAEALIVQFPTWCFGPPAMFKGFLDRLFVPGVAMDMGRGPPRPLLINLRRIVGVVTYGQPRLAAFMMGDLPRHTVKRFLPWFSRGRARTRYCPLYGVDGSSEKRRQAYLAKVERLMSRL